MSPRIDAARGYFEQGQFNPALIEVRSALQIEPSSEAANVLLGQIYLELGLPAQAINKLEPMQGVTKEYFDALVNAYINRGKYGTALLFIRKHTDQFPMNDPQTHVYMAKTRIGLQDIEAAVKSFNKARELDPNNFEARVGLVRTVAMRGDLELAETQITLLLQEVPGNIELMNLLGAIYVRQGRLEQAETQLTEMIFSLPSTDIYTSERADVIRNMIRLLSFQGRSGEALFYQKMLSEAFPNSEQVNQQMSEVINSMQGGDYATALQLLDEIENVAPNNETTGTLRAVIAFVQGDNELAQDLFLENVDTELASSRTLQSFAANQFALNQPHKVVQILERMSKSTTNPDTLALYAVAALSAGKREEGLEALRKAINLAPENLRLPIIYARFLGTSDPGEALSILERAHNRAPENHDVWLALSSEYRRHEKFNEAIDFGRSLTRQFPNNFVAPIILGGALARAGQHVAAAEAYQDSLDLNKDNINAHFGLGATYLHLEKLVEAEAQYRKIVEIDSEITEAYARLLSIYAGTGRASEGIAILSELAELHESSAPLAAITAYLSLTGDEEQIDSFISMGDQLAENRYWRATSASIYFRRAQQNMAEEDYSSARSNVFKALNAFPANKSLLGLLIQIELQGGSVEEATRVAHQLAEFHPSSDTLFISLGDLAIAQGSREEATINYRLAWQANSMDLTGQKYYELLRATDRHLAAAEFLSEWSVKIPDSVVAKIQSAQLLADDGDTKAAIEAYESLLIAHPNSLSIQNNLAWLYVEDERFADGVKLAQQAFEKNSENGNIADTYGWALHKAGKSDLAIDILSKAVELSDSNNAKEHLRLAKGASDTQK